MTTIHQQHYENDEWLVDPQQGKVGSWPNIRMPPHGLCKPLEMNGITLGRRRHP